MSKKSEQELLIKEYLDEVTKKLPIWIKTDVKESKDFRIELEDHIWDKATELAEGKEPEAWHIREAIDIMGSPRKITREYRRRGKPKFYITEELWPLFYKSLIVVAAIVVFVNLISMAFKIGKATASQIAAELFGGIFDGFLIGFVALSLIFVQLSMNGFLPEDLKKIAEPRKDVVSMEIKKMKEIKPKKIIPSQTELLINGIMGFAFGFTLIFFPFANFTEYYAFDMVGVTQWLRLLGGIIVFSGLIAFSRGLIGKHLRFQQLFITLSLIPSSLAIALFLQLLSNSTILIDPLLSVFPGADILLYVKIGVIFIVVMTIFGMLNEISRIVKLELHGFPMVEETVA
ncbi:MAG: hypothetical protein HGN29_16715 [Asgard group archaeon]|nr:hypothetical protein [Asgard group archaeon]